jgi:DNA-binding response OmpR family regulator
MSSAATIVLAREDLSIPGAPPKAGAPPDNADAIQRRFFSLVEANKPDVIVLDFSTSPRSSTDTILTIRRRSTVPILVVCNPAQTQAREYRIAGADDCITAPVGLLGLSQAVRRILRRTGSNRAPATRRPVNFSFAGMSLLSERNLLVADDGSSLVLTNLEGRLLAHFMSRPWTLCSRAEIGKLLYGHEDAVGTRAIGQVVNRLRKKLSRLVRLSASSLIKTKIRHGYWLAADVTALPRRTSALPW